MLHPKPICRTKNRGFALVIALSMMSFVLLLLLSMSLLVSVETANAHNSKLRLLAKENARLGMLVAIGNLQRYAGPDQRVTARAQIDAGSSKNAVMWTGVWDSNSGSAQNPVWLVSGENPNPSSGALGSSPSTLYASTTEFSGVQAEWVPIEGGQNLAEAEFAYWIEEQSVKARVNQADKTKAMEFLNDETEAMQDIRENLQLHPSQDFVFNALIPDTEPDDSLLEVERIEELGRAETASQIGFSFPTGVDVANNLHNQHHDYTAYSLGILENPIDGGLKTNLTGRTQVDIDGLLAQPTNARDHYLKGDYLLHFNIDPATGIPLPKNANPNSPNNSKSSLNSNGDFIRLPIEDYYDFRDNATDPDDNEMQVIRNIMPVVSEVSFRLGAFHTQSDTKHRIRFHVDVEFWNPYPFPIRFPGEGQNRSFIAMMVPSEIGSNGFRGTPAEQMILSIEKIGEGFGRFAGQVEEELHTNLFDFDEDLGSVIGGGATNNSINETVISSWMVVDDAVIQPGEVYWATTSKSNGLARDLGGYILKTGGKPEAAEDYIPDPDHDYNKWSWHTTKEPSHPVLEETDTVRISLRMPENGISFRLIPFDSASTSQTPVYEEANNEWANPVFELKNIYKVTDTDLLVDELTPSEYSRSSSGSYTLSNFNIGFHFRLMDDFIVGTDASAANIGLGFDLRQPVWDYENPQVRRALMVGGIDPEDAENGAEPSPFGLTQQDDLFNNFLDILADESRDSHTGIYRRAFLYPRPDGEPLSVGSFRNLPLSPESVITDTDGDGTDETVQKMAGMPWGDSLNEAFDKYYYTGVPASDWTTDQPMPIPAKLRIDATEQSMRETNAAENLLIEGSFNVNSLSARAWASMLSRTVHEWEYNGTSGKTRAALKNAFFNLSYSTDEAIGEIGTLSEESELTTSDPNDLSGPESLGRLAMSHPLRRPSDLIMHNPDTPDDDSLVEFLIDELKKHFLSNPPYASVSEFIDSGVLANAIRRSEINGSIPIFSPAYITQAVMLESIAPFLTVRSDTFIVRSVGHSKNPISGETTSKTFCEAIVQRIPDRVDRNSALLMENATSGNNIFGRRFVIKDIRWTGDDT